jgi:hypothetical protein
MTSFRVLAVVVAMLSYSATAGNALTYNWSYDATGGTSLGPVTGTISGLVEGSNDGTGLTINVLSTPSGNVLGGGWSFVSTLNGGDAFTVTAGAVVFADAQFNRDANNDRLLLGGYGGFLPQLISFNEPDNGNDFTEHNTTFGTTTFTPASEIPLPMTLPMFASGLGALGLFAWRRRKKPAHPLPA